VQAILISDELSDSNVLERNRVVCISRDHNIPVAVGMTRRQQRVYVCKRGMIKLGHIGARLEICNNIFAKVGGKYKRIRTRAPPLDYRCPALPR
jgi:hypothetical protein